MQRVYHKYTEWEDYQNGMFSLVKTDLKEILIEKSIGLLSNKDEFLIACKKVIKKWVIASEENLTNNTSNRRAWLGQAACCIIHKCPETITRIAWGKLEEDKKIQANNIADKIIRSYEINYKPIYKGLGEQMLLKWNT